MPGILEVGRRAASQATGRVRSLPILALNVHSACNCRCVMCDIWKANAERREITPEAMAAHVDAIRRLHVRRVMLTGGEPLLNRNLWVLCRLLAAERIVVTLVTTGLLIEKHAAEIGRAVDTVVVSLDGPREVHDAIRRVPGGFDRIVGGILALQAAGPRPRLIARSVVQRGNYGVLAETIGAARGAGFDEISFLAADVSSTAFNRAEPWDVVRRAEVAVPKEELAQLQASIACARASEGDALSGGFVVGGEASLVRILRYYAALGGAGDFPDVRCNAPWVSAVLEPDGTVRPCFFHGPYPRVEGQLDDAINSSEAIAFRRALHPAKDATCRRCVCSLNLPLLHDV